MKDSTIAISDTNSGNTRTGLVDGFARNLVHKQLEAIREGLIIIRENDAEYYFGSATDAFPVTVKIEVLDKSVWSDIAFGGSAGSGEAYMKGSWSCSDLTGLVRIFLRNREALDNLDERFTRLKAPLNKMFHWMSRNTKKGSRKNIQAHYDLGNDLFETFLDPTMMYSSAWYASAETSLEEASVAKMDRICRKLELDATDHLLEIGTGWGGFAMHAAKNYGCRVTTTTISREQYDLATQRVREAGLEDRITLLLKDYRDLDGQYDKLVSIEMIEAIGHQYMSRYFAKCNELLKSNGMMMLQAITIADQRYQSALREVDFIKKFIFPGGFLPSITEMMNVVTQKTEMKMSYLEDIGPHYARTLSDWRERFMGSLEKVKQLGYPDSFIRMWEYYLCYCEGGFTERDIGTVQMLLVKPDSRGMTIGSA
jgi:cyclopropane-fatty-acyl-phospholipid synthase